jgi:RimJ/RimL family protein N-acetyltransferase
VGAVGFYKYPATFYAASNEIGQPISFVAVQESGYFCATWRDPAYRGDNEIVKQIFRMIAEDLIHDKLKLNSTEFRISAHIDNIPANKICIKFGFELEETITKNNQQYNIYVMSLSEFVRRYYDSADI